MAVEISFSSLSCHNCTDNLKKHRGCDSKPLQPYLLDGKELSRCPIKMITPFTDFCTKYYQYFLKGFLPFEGTILQQPAKLLEAYDIIEREVARCVKEREERENKKNKKKMRV